MTFKIWTESAINDGDDKATYLRLRDFKDGDVALEAVNKNGDLISGGGILVLLAQPKYIMLLDDLSDEVPLKTDFESHPLTITNSEFKEMVKKRESEMVMSHIKKHIENNNDEHKLSKH